MCATQEGKWGASVMQKTLPDVAYGGSLHAFFFLNPALGWAEHSNFIQFIQSAANFQLSLKNFIIIRRNEWKKFCRKIRNHRPHPPNKGVKNSQSYHFKVTIVNIWGCLFQIFYSHLNSYSENNSITAHILIFNLLISFSILGPDLHGNTYMLTTYLMGPGGNFMPHCFPPPGCTTHTSSFPFYANPLLLGI